MLQFKGDPSDSIIFVYHIHVHVPVYYMHTDIIYMLLFSFLQEELTALSIVGTKLIKESATFERLDVDQELALEMFKDNKHKCQQIPDIAKSSVTGSQVTLYKLLDYVDIASGPLLESTYHLFQFNITKVRS